MKFDDLAEAQKRMKEISKETPEVVDGVTKGIATDLLAAVQENLTGKAGMPRRVTGEYQASWSIVKLDGSIFRRRYALASSAPQVRRLEYGFVGEDAMGRLVQQAPLPHLRPAAETVMQGVRDKYKDALREMFQ